jgi:hypothetical protein
MNDHELDQLLAKATHPQPQSGFHNRLLQRLEEQQGNKVIAFPVKKQKAAWLIGLPLAASLVLGLWLGASGRLTNIIPLTTSEVASVDTSTTGFEDVLTIIEDELT